MSCNCKQAQRIGKKMPAVTLPEYKKQGVWKMLNIIKQYLWKLLGCVVVAVFMIIGIPIIALIVTYNYCTKGEMMMSLPFINKQQKTKQ